MHFIKMNKTSIFLTLLFTLTILSSPQVLAADSPQITSSTSINPTITPITFSFSSIDTSTSTSSNSTSLNSTTSTSTSSSTSSSSSSSSSSSITSSSSSMTSLTSSSSSRIPDGAFSLVHSSSFDFQNKILTAFVSLSVMALAGLMVL